MLPNEQGGILNLPLNALIGRALLAIFRFNGNNAVSVYDLLVPAIRT
jgi:hypothetical protein